jgi:hypothetical protein
VTTRRTSVVKLALNQPVANNVTVVAAAGIAAIPATMAAIRKTATANTAPLCAAERERRSAPAKLKRAHNAVT